jgi:hypothetical protein
LVEFLAKYSPKMATTKFFVVMRYASMYDNGTGGFFKFKSLVFITYLERFEIVHKSFQAPVESLKSSTSCKFGTEGRSLIFRDTHKL